LNFSLSGDQGAIGLYLPNLTPIDQILYQSQRLNVSQGRSPNGGSTVVFFDQPTPGGPNPLISTTPPALVIPVFAMSNVWRYEITGTNLGTAWRETNFSDARWPSGPGLLGYETATLPEPIRTQFTPYNASIITYYFRAAFVAPTNGNITALQISHYIDDGAVFYLNGQELLRFNMPAGTVSYTTQASSAPTDASLQGPVTASAAALQAGTNVLAVEVHQNGTTSSDIVFGMALDALVVTNAAPSGSVVLNEVLANNASLAEADSSTPDWVELYNQSSGLVDLSGLSLTDDTLQPRRWVFPNGVQIAPRGFLRLFFDGGLPASTTNTGFGLQASGGGVYLFDAPANGGSLLSAITYGLQVADLSIGRVPDGSTNWVLTSPTPGTLNLAVTSLGDPAALRVNEWMADPASGDDWFEIYNPGTQPVAVGGLHLTDDLNSPTKHTIPALSFLGTGTNAWQKFIADRNTGAGADHVGFALAGGGEAVGISTTSGTLIDGYAFGPQQAGVSEGRFADGGPNVVSFPGTASPGESNYRWLTNAVVNEALTHTPTNTPLEDAIELHNLSDQPIDVGGWWLSDDPGTLQKYRIPYSTVLPAHGFLVLYENQFTNRELAAIPFALSSRGDEVVLAAATNNVLTGWRTLVKFGAADSAVSFGRYVTSDHREEFVAMSARTFGVDDPGTVEEFRQGTGASNAYPRVGPVVISEIMYHPPDLDTNDNVRDEFIELHNISTAPVELYDPAYPTNVWHLRDAVDFDFPPGTVLPPGGYLLVVSFDPVNNPSVLATFRARYQVDPSVPIVGPYRGKLANDSEDLELKKPGTPTTNEVPYILVEHIHYFDGLPWPEGADGSGFSLQRVNEPLFGNDPANWTAASPTPGPQASPVDSDGDGMPNAWEDAYGFDPFNPADAALDSDSDGLTNLQEFQAGTNPRDRQSVLRFDSIALAPDGTNLVLRFTAAANQTYTVEFTDALGAGVWQGLFDIDAAPTNRVIQLLVPASGPMRFYRIRTPWRLSPQALLRIESFELVPGTSDAVLTFNAAPNQSYTVEYADQFGAGWNRLSEIDPAPSQRVIRLTTSVTAPYRFYRVRTPRLP
jgi:hypothetical protein